MKLIKPEPSKTVTIEITVEEIEALRDIMYETKSEWFKERGIETLDKISADIHENCVKILIEIKDQD